MRNRSGHRPKLACPFVLRGFHLILFLLAVPFVALSTAALLTEPACAQETEARVGVIVDDGEGDDIRSCIDPRETGGSPARPTQELNGIQALEMTGHDLVTKDFGGALGMAVCKIDGVGTDDCNFDAGFWAYYHRAPDGSFQFSEVGPSSYQVPAGGIEAWVWAPAGTEAASPDPVTLEEICVQSVTTLEQTVEEERNPALGWILAGAAVVVVAGSFLLVRVFTRGS